MATKKRNFFSGFKIFDYLVILGLLSFVLAFFLFFFRKSQYLTVKLKVTEKNVLYANSNPPYWFVYLFKKGMQEKDGLGRVSAELLDVYYYDTSPETRAAYLTLRLKTTYNSRTKEHKYKGVAVAVGEGLRINLGKILVEGLVVETESLKNSESEAFMTVKAQPMESDPVFSETTGIEPFVAEAIKVGDKVFDSSGRLMAEVLEKEAAPAKKNTFDNLGNVYQKFDPRRKDVILTLKIRVKKINNEYYFFDDIRIKVSQAIPLHFGDISIYPRITRIEKIEGI